MIKVKDIAEKYGEYEIDEEKLKEILIEPKPKTVWDMKQGDTFFSIDPYVGVVPYTWYNHNIGCHRIRNIGDMFLTKEEAEFEFERRKVEAEMLKYGGTRDMMSLGDENVKKYYIVCFQNTKYLDIAWIRYVNHQGAIYFKSEEDARNAIDNIGEDRIKKYIFNVKE